MGAGGGPVHIVQGIKPHFGFLRRCTTLIKIGLKLPPGCIVIRAEKHEGV